MPQPCDVRAAGVALRPEARGPGARDEHGDVGAARDGGAARDPHRPRRAGGAAGGEAPRLRRRPRRLRGSRPGVEGVWLDTSADTRQSALKYV